MSWKFWIWSLIFFLATGGVHAQNSARDERLEVRLIHHALDQNHFRVGVHFRVQPEWHIYWKNPGDSGSAPKFAWRPPEAVGQPSWPLPKRFFVGDLVNLGYEEEVVILFDVDRSRVPAKLELDLEWLVCKVECVPGFAKLSADLGEATSPSDVALIQKFEALLPGPGTAAPAVSLARMDEEGLRLQIGESGVELFAIDGAVLSAKPARQVEGDYVLAWADGRIGAPPAQVDLLLAWTGDQGVRSAEIRVDLRTHAQPTWSDLGLLFFAFLGGVILNLMPCVFPVLSIKILSMVDAVGGDKTALRGNGWAYTGGVVLTFVMLGAALLLVRAAGQQVGWGFQLQSPIIVSALAALFYLLALNFLGAFEFGEGLMNRAGRVSVKGSGRVSSFATGVLSVFIAAPCTGPFMGSALGATVVLPPWAGLGIFASLGLGMAMPFLLLAYFPAWTRRLPRPGRWMETLRQFFAFPLLATVLWLLWVLQMQTSGDALITVLAAFLVIGFLLWVRGKMTRAGVRSLVAVLIGVVLLGALWSVARGPVGSSNGAATSTSDWAPYDEGKIAQARAEGRPIFIDFTAAWCVTCQWNKKAVLDTSVARELFQSKNTYLVRADWTDRDEEITKALAVHGRASVPLYLFEEPGGAVRVLPQLLTISMIEELFQNPKEDSK